LIQPLWEPQGLQMQLPAVLLRVRAPPSKQASKATEQTELLCGMPRRCCGIATLSLP